MVSVAQSSSSRQADNEALLVLARSARAFAYAPYSGFDVGAMAVTASGDMACGANIANASYGLTICAERVAIFGLVAAGHREIVRLAIAVKAADGIASTAMPCGACLQVMSEFMPLDASILIDGFGEFRLVDLLPTPFRLQRKFT
jgi:cytidine deaminase